MTSALDARSSPEVQSLSRSKKLQLLGILSGFTAGAWLGAAEAPTKLVSIGISPIAISLIMVIGVFLARWSLPALILGTSSVRADVRRAPHLIIWAVLAGCLWAVANTLTIFAIRDIGLSIAFPLWNSFSSTNCAKPAGAAGLLCSAARSSCALAPRCSPSPLPRKVLPVILCGAFGPRSALASSGARCTFPIARLISPA